MKVFDIVPRNDIGLFGAMVKKQAEIHKNGRGTFVRGCARTRSAAHWAHLRYKGSLDFKRGDTDA